MLRRLSSLLPATALALVGLMGSSMGSPSALRTVSPDARAWASTPAAYTSINGVRLNGFEARLVDLVNATRTAHGLHALTVTPGTTDVARSWSKVMANQDGISHNPNLVNAIQAGGSPSWGFIAENVGEGPADQPDLLFSAYMASEHHRDNILDPRAKYIGMGTVERHESSGFVNTYNTMDFVDSYTSTYGVSRVPAWGHRMDSIGALASRTIASFESGRDLRVAATNGGHTAVRRLTFDAPGTGDQAARMLVSDTGVVDGAAGIYLRDALDLSDATTLTVRLVATTPTHVPVPVTVSLAEPWNGASVLGTTTVGSTPKSVTFTLPAGARSFRNQLSITVKGSSLEAISSDASQRYAMVGIYAITTS